MAQRRSSMIDPPIESLLDRVDSKFTLVTVAAKRARQINAYFNQLGEGLGTVAPPQVTSVSRKPLSIALEEMVQDKLILTRPGDAEAAAAGAASADGEPATFEPVPAGEAAE